MIADEHKVAGVACLGYPFHPARKPTVSRFEHLKTIQTPTLICQGEHDPKGTLQEIQPLTLSDSVQFNWLTDGDNDFRPPENSAQSHEQNMQNAIKASNNFVMQVLKINKSYNLE